MGEIEYMVQEYDLETNESTIRPMTEAERTEAVARISEQTESVTVEETERTNEETLRDQLKTGLAQIDNHLAILNGAPTVAEQRAALIFTLRAVKRLVRLELRELDSVS